MVQQRRTASSVSTATGSPALAAFICFAVKFIVSTYWTAQSELHGRDGSL